MSEPRKARPWLPPLLLLAFAFVVYGWTLLLPWSFFDDVPYFLIQARETQQHFAAGEISDAVDSLMRWDENNLGPSVRIYVYIQWIILGTWSAAWHFIKILTFFLTVWGLRAFVRELKGGIAAQVIAILTFTFFGASSFHTDFQTHFINFARLLTTDSIMTPAALWAAVLALRMTPQSTSWQRILLALCVVWCALTKATAIHFTASLILWFLLHRKWIDALLSFTSSLPGLLFFRLWEGNPVFGYVNLPLPRTPGAVLEIAGSYASICTEALGVLWILALVYTGIRAFRDRREFLLPLVLFATGFMVQCLWPLIFTRYAIIFTPWLCPLVGIFVAEILPGRLASVPLPRRLLLVAALVPLLALMLLTDWLRALPIAAIVALALLLCGLSLVHAVCAALQRQCSGKIEWLSLEFLLSSVLLHTLITCCYTIESAGSYLGYERAIWQTAVYTQKLKEENSGQPIVVYTDFVAEHFNRLLSILGIAPAVTLKPYPAEGLKTLRKNERLLIWNQSDNMPSFLPQQAARGMFVRELARATTTTDRLKESITLPIAIPAGATITHLYLNADSDGWPRHASIAVQLGHFEKGRDHVEIMAPSLGGAGVPPAQSSDGREASENVPTPGEKTVLLGTLKETDLTRPFMGPQKLVLNQPVVLSNAATSITLTAPGASPTLNTKSFLEDPPTVSLWGATDAIPFEKIAEYTEDTAGPVIYAPSFVLQSSLFNKRMPEGARLRAIAPKLHHKYSIELYGPSTDHGR